jgi:ABC-type bacteriocin/lantibiotic exporter with double-glycine peptidase domain
MFASRVLAIGSIAVTLAVFDVVVVTIFLRSTTGGSELGIPRPNQQGSVAVVHRDPSYPCGPVSIAVVTHLHGKPTRLSETKQLAAPDALGRNSMAEMLNCFRELGYQAVGVKVRCDKCKYLTVPLVVYQDNSQFVVAVSKKDGRVVVFDPPYRLTDDSWEGLFARSDGAAIIVAKDDAELAEALTQLEMNPKAAPR